MFRRAAMLLDFVPGDGQRVQLRGRLGVYEPRGELQLVAETMREAGQGNIFEQFAKLKSRLEAEGLFDANRKRSVKPIPRRIGVVTSLGAAALHDVVSVLERRIPHIPVVICPASVQGTFAAAQLREALVICYQQEDVDVILLVRGGGAMEYLWPFNDEQLARTIVMSPVPVICGIGHETDFTIADFCADVRAPTPTAAAELCAQPQAALFQTLFTIKSRLQEQVERRLQANTQRLDIALSRFHRPSHFVAKQQARLAHQAQDLRYAQRAAFDHVRAGLAVTEDQVGHALRQSLRHHQQRQHQVEVKLEMLNPQHVLKRGYAWLATMQGEAVTQVEKLRVGQPVTATLVDGTVEMTVCKPRLF